MAKMKSVVKRPIKSKIGWTMLDRFTDQSTQWVPLRILNEVNTIESAECAVDNSIEEELAFRYWVPFTLRNRDRIVSSITHLLRKTTSRFVIEILFNIDDV